MLFVSAVPHSCSQFTSNAPHESEADLKGWGVVLKADNYREEEGRDEVGHGDNN